MKSPYAELPTSVKKKKLSLLKSALANGRPLEQFTQEDRDLIHMEESGECLTYWTLEKKLACEKSDDDRIVLTDSRRRYLLLVLHKPEANDTDDVRLAYLDYFIAKSDALPGVHRS